MKTDQNLSLVECPRDAMQGVHDFIPTNRKIEYINRLLKVGFDTLDCGSFVSPKAIPQMADTKEVIEKIEWEGSDTKLLTIVANKRGAQDAVAFDQISYLGYPFSISEEFQKRNTNSTIEQSLVKVEEIQELAKKHGKQLVVYISMAFGNPYGEKWHPELAVKWAERLHKELEVDILAMSDTIGSSTPENIKSIFEATIPEFEKVTFGAHLHTTPATWQEKIEAAFYAGCRRFDGALKGFGGCPMAKDELTGNMPMENMLGWFEDQKLALGIDQSQLQKALKEVLAVFPA